MTAKRKPHTSRLHRPIEATPNPNLLLRCDLIGQRFAGAQDVDGRLVLHVGEGHACRWQPQYAPLLFFKLYIPLASLGKTLSKRGQAPTRV